MRSVQVQCTVLLIRQDGFTGKERNFIFIIEHGSRTECRFPEVYPKMLSHLSFNCNTTASLIHDSTYCRALVVSVPQIASEEGPTEFSCARFFCNAVASYYSCQPRMRF